ncbi:MAG: hypothetical protein R8K48_06475 [Gallionella sp.]
MYKLEKREEGLLKQRNEPYFLMQQSGFFKQSGLTNVTAHLDDALICAKEFKDAR